MNKKFLFGMLVSGAMLAACTADDDLNVAKVAQNVNPSAPVFNVVFEDEDVQNRAAWVEGSAKVNFEAGDLLSLFHGVENTGTDAVPVYSAFSGFENAIYEGASNGDGYTFSTKSMVYKGAAVLVWPADTTMAWRTEAKTGGPLLKIADKQDEMTKKKTPYISEIMHIAEYTGDSLNHEEGYGRKYDIIMKRIGGTLKLNIKKAAADQLPSHVAALEIESVELQAGTSGAKFTTQIPVVIGANMPASYVAADASKNKPANHPYWYKASDVDPSAVSATDGQVEKLSTTDIVETETGVYANFTVLPVKQTSGTNDAFSGASVTVKTNYGLKKFDDSSAKISSKDIWNGSQMKSDGTAENKDVVVTTGLNNAFNFLWHDAATGSIFNKATTTGSAGATEKNGTRTTCTLNADLKGLDMNNLHIKNEQHLKDAIDVYNAVSSTKNVIFILDGEKDGDNKGKFVMTKDTWKKVEAQLAKSGNKLSFQPCVDKDEECTVILLNNNTGEAQEVPALQFNTVPAVDLNIELVGEDGWTYTSETSGDKAKNIAGVTEIHVTEGVNLTPSGFIAVYGDDESAAATIKLVIDEGASMSVASGSVAHQIDVDNYGTITISKGAELRAGQTVGSTPRPTTLTNCSEAQKPAGEEQLTGLTCKSGVINNGGTLGVVGDATKKYGYIYNYGVINITEPTATTAITRNQTAMGSFLSQYATATGSERILGTINLYKIDDEKVSVDGMKGFIKATVNVKDPKYADFGGDKCAANYIILGPNCESITYDEDDKGNPTNLPKNISYLDVQSALVDFRGEYTLRGLIVRENCKLDVVASATLEADKGYYLEGHVGVIGTVVNGDKLTTYYGKTSADHFTYTGTSK